MIEPLQEGKVIGDFDIVTNCEDALDRYRAQVGKYGLFVVDEVIPGGMSGLDFIDQINEHEPCIVISGSQNETLPERAMIRKAYFLAKPFDGWQLRNLIRISLGNSELERHVSLPSKLFF